MKNQLLIIAMLLMHSFAFSQITITSTVTNVSCFGGSNGTASITATGGSGAYTYTWLPTNTNFDVITGLAAGTYTVHVEDAVANTSSLVITVTEPALLTATLTTTNPTCNGFCDGTGSVDFSGGTGTTTFLWEPGLQSGNFVNNLCAGNNTVTITSNGACTTLITFTLTEPTQLTAVTSATNSNCGQANGAICASVTGGTSPYTFLWNNSSVTSCVTTVPAGAYNYTVTDSNGCSANASGLVNDVAGPVVSISSQTNVSCFGLCNGAANVSVTGGIAPYAYTWSNGQTGISGFGLCAGLYSVTVTDNAGCLGFITVNITEPTQLNAIINANNVKCFGTNTGTIAAVVSGGTSPYSYSWSIFSSTLSVVTNVAAGNYSAIITDANGCVATNSVTVTQPTQLDAVVSSTNASCFGTCNGSANVIVSGGVGGYAFVWNTTPTTTTQFASNLCVGIYTIDVTDANNCLVTNVITILSGSNSLPNATITTTVYNETCYLTGDGAIDLNISGTNPGPFTYQWSNGATTQDITNVPSDIYWVNITDGNSNCMALVDTVNFIGINCGTISGNVYIDNNGDCIKNSGDNNYSNASIIVHPGNRLGYSNTNGDYIVSDLPYGTYSVSINYILPNVNPSCITTLTSVVNAGSPNSINNNLSVAFNSVAQPDLHVSAWNAGIVPGFVCRMNYNLSNLNNISGTGLFKATLPSVFIPNITNMSLTTYTLSGDTIIWDFSNVTYTDGTHYFYVDFSTPLSIPLGSIFTSCMWAQPTVADLNYTNNTYCYSRMVTGSYDPNDKTPNPIGIGATGDIAASVTDLTYLIRFQNTGNGPAVNIKITDTLSPNLNVNTFEMLCSSHNYNIDILEGNILRWKFNNIMLPDSNSNEPASHGYIQYRIKRTTNNTPGTQIKNTAYIYFDFNEPVVTNTAFNTIETITGIKSPNKTDDQWSIYPNPSAGTIYIVNHSSIKESSQIQILNSIGQTVFEETFTDNYKNIDLSKLTNGIYFVKIVSDKQSLIKRVVLSK